MSRLVEGAIDLKIGHNIDAPGALRAIASKLEQGEIRSLFVCVLQADGRPRVVNYLYPETAERDMNTIGGVLVDTADSFAKALKLGVSTI